MQTKKGGIFMRNHRGGHGHGGFNGSYGHGAHGHGSHDYSSHSTPPCGYNHRSSSYRGPHHYNGDGLGIIGTIIVVFTVIGLILSIFFGILELVL